MILRFGLSALIVGTLGILYATPHLLYGRENMATANLLFLLGLLGLVIGAIFHVLQSGFLTLFLRGFADIRQLFIRQSKALREENERLRSDESLSAWKTSMFRHLKVYTSGCGTGLILCSMILMGIS
ncbi:MULTISPECIES: DUF3899 domain-containing protein [Paenibacillus]|jgi:hypothetical protein|uniref:DUF3899 domain-containing protein n=1 Tax=Paenibacillus polymyxa TaxID=1406 RepID=A0AAP4A0T1_PAEPO|nr:MULTISPECIES: DUF3899 domain-containing protein [Paenibacillus]AHC18586.1 hypothetical protein X809_04630 [Paenibacillus polymyxa CR1]MDH2333222.1 DUF3899 domain-containing protein [Paenibacillus polymyxa]OMF76456.1 hypothetical protein BK145_21155 [Paenibacillus peoriae]POR26359.1 DUF3899 domain-containing protein [Paenibacillus polymyxa]